MAEYIVNRPDEEVMRRILQQNPDNAVGAILRLAWQAGLLREEIQTLTWAQIDFQDRRIVLPDREVPLEEELADWLETLRRERNRSSEAVVLSDRDRKPVYFPAGAGRAGQGGADEGAAHRPAPRLRTPAACPARLAVCIPDHGDGGGGPQRAFWDLYERKARLHPGQAGRDGTH